MKKILLFLSLILIPTASFGIEDVKKVYLQEAINVALENNIDLQAAKLEISIAKNNIQNTNKQNQSYSIGFYDIGNIPLRTRISFGSI